MTDFSPEDLQNLNAPEKNSTGRSIGIFTIEVLKVVLVALAIVLPVRFFLVQPFYVKGASMEPTFFDYEYLLIDEISYEFNPPTRGDVVVMHDPLHPSQFFIKRVIGLPGETVQIADGFVTIKNAQNPNGVTLTEDYLAKDTYTRGTIEEKLGETEFFVLGDNRDASLDSRVFGSVEQDLIVGRTWVRAWPFDRLTKFNPVNYNL